ncbi:MAG: hypothetical protein VB098_13165, partial [Petrimonas sp.]|nr:hypothetical protein [Petrimonas sp.]
NFAYHSRMMMLIVTAMREIGEGNITDNQMKIIKSHLKNVPVEDMKKDTQLAPAWVRKKLLEE